MKTMKLALVAAIGAFLFASNPALASDGAAAATGSSLAGLGAGLATGMAVLGAGWGIGREITTQDLGTFLVVFQGFCLGGAACLLLSTPSSSLSFEIC